MTCEEAKAALAKAQQAENQTLIDKQAAAQAQSAASADLASRQAAVTSDEISLELKGQSRDQAQARVQADREVLHAHPEAAASEASQIQADIAATQAAIANYDDAKATIDSDKQKLADATKTMNDAITNLMSFDAKIREAHDVTTAAQAAVDAACKPPGPTQDPLSSFVGTGTTPSTPTVDNNFTSFTGSQSSATPTPSTPVAAVPAIVPVPAQQPPTLVAPTTGSTFANLGNVDSSPPSNFSATFPVSSFSTGSLQPATASSFGLPGTFTSNFNAPATPNYVTASSPTFGTFNQSNALANLQSQANFGNPFGSSGIIVTGNGGGGGGDTSSNLSAGTDFTV